MKILTAIALAAIALSALAGHLVYAEEQQPDKTTPQEVISALVAANGDHPGLRKNHAKGFCAAGYFVGLPEAAQYSRSAIFSGVEVPVVVRFSLGGGNSDAPDTARSPRGIGIEYRLADGAKQHMTMINASIFFTKEPSGFLELTVATTPDPATGKPDPAAIDGFKEKHPDSCGFMKYMAEHNPPPSFANTPFFGIHTFKFIGKDDKVTLVKWRFEPEDGIKFLSDDELKASPPNFLQPALLERVKQSPVKWNMVVTLGKLGDPETDPTKLWPSDRKGFKAGTLTLTAATPGGDGECKNINYDPLVMADGIAPTDDAVLRFRSPSYAASFVLRLEDK